MKAIQLQQPGGLDKLEIVELPDPGQPGPSEIRVRIHASSLNFHDLGVVLGKAPTAQSRIPMSDGAGVVEAVGENVHEFRVGDKVVSTFFPDWISGEPTTANFSRTPGDGIDGYAREIVIAPFTAFTHAPHDYTHAEAATLTTAALTAWRALVVEGGIKAGDDVLVLAQAGYPCLRFNTPRQWVRA
jgi:NADPH:quinone reductase-like Zn-dependent oxidoreductase